MTEPNGSSKKIGLWTTTSLIVGNMIGAGVFMLPSAMASFGSIGLLGWIFAATGTFFLARVFSNLSKMLPHVNGGPYAYTQTGLGNFASFLVAWGYYLSVMGANSAITISLVSALSTFSTAMAHNSLISLATGLAATWFLSYANLRGVALAGKVQFITTLLKIIPLILVIIGGLFFIQKVNYLPFNNTHGSVYSAITAAATMTMFSFVGIECATIPAAGVENPGKTIPRATMLGLAIATVIYLSASAGIMGLFPAARLQQSVTPFSDAAAMIYGVKARYWVSAGVAIAAFGALNGWTIMQGYMPFAIAKDQLFPAIFARQNKKGVPYAGILFSSAVVSLLLWMNYSKGLVDQFKQLLLLSVFTTLIPYLFSSAAYLIIRLKEKRTDGLAGAIVIGAAAFAYSLWAIAGAGRDAVYEGFLLLMAGIPIYIWQVRKRQDDETETEKLAALDLQQDDAGSN